MFQVVPPCGGHLPVAFGLSPRMVCFKSCPRVGGIPKPLGASKLHIAFQVVPPCGGHQGLGNEFLRILQVSSRAPVWGASRTVWEDYFDLKFQVVPPCGGHPRTPLPCCRSRLCFKSCPRVGGIKWLEEKLAEYKVSSRAPVWGASTWRGGSPHRLSVSSRAPVWGASVILHKKHVANLCKICIFLPNCRF